MTIKLNSLFLACIFTISAHTAMYALEAPATAPRDTQEEQSSNIVIPTKKKNKTMLIALNSAKILAGLNMLPLSGPSSIKTGKTVLGLYKKIPSDTLLDEDERLLRTQLICDTKKKEGYKLYLMASLSMLHLTTALGLICDGTRNLYNLLWKEEEQAADNKIPEPENSSASKPTIIGALS